MNTIRMVAKVGDQEVNIGTCHPAQARVLVRMELASWHEGKLLVLLKPAFLRVGHGWMHPEENPGDVSDAELARRKKWFTYIMGKGAPALAEALKVKSDLDRILAVHRRDEIPRPEPKCTLTDEEVEAFFSCDEPIPSDLPQTEEELRSLWEQAPVLSGPPGDYRGPLSNVPDWGADAPDPEPEPSGLRPTPPDPPTEAGITEYVRQLLHPQNREDIWKLREHRDHSRLPKVQFAGKALPCIQVKFNG